MGHGLMPYAIDWKRVTTLYGCGDETLLGVDPENSELIEDIVRGRPLDPDASEEYHFALAALCHTVGRRLTNDWFARTSFEHLADVEQGLQAIGATRFIFGVGVEAEHPSLLPIPFPDDFPGVYVFPPDVCDEAAKQISASTHTLDEAVALAIHEIAEWLTARQPGEGIVVFHY